eukprot:g8136.t1
MPNGDYVFVEPNVSCTDTCDKHPSLTSAWEGRVINASKEGYYVRKYVCEDSEANTVVERRTWIFNNNSGPMIALNGKNPLKIEARRGQPYKDAGARCTDADDYYVMLAENKAGSLDSRVQASGVGAVNVSKPGTYLISYSCNDTEGRNASVETRKVVVQDTTCVNLTLLVPKVEVVEAGFRYVAPARPVAADDALEGDLSGRVTTDGDTVNVARAFISRTSCLEIKNDCDSQPSTFGTCPSGYYYITVFPKHATNGTRLRVYCDMETDDGGYTMYAVKDGKRTYSHNDSNTCEDMGMQMVVPRTEAHFRFMLDPDGEFGPTYFAHVPGVYGTAPKNLTGSPMRSGDGGDVDATWHAVDGGSWWLRDSPYWLAPGYKPGYKPYCWLLMETRGSQVDGQFTIDDLKFTDRGNADGIGCPVSVTNYICSTNDHCEGDQTCPGVAGRPDGVQLIDTPGIFHEDAETGVYVIKYHVRDSADNQECNATQRTVIVKDTMKPQILLKLNDKVA